MLCRLLLKEALSRAPCVEQPDPLAVTGDQQASEANRDWTGPCSLASGDRAETGWLAWSVTYDAIRDRGKINSSLIHFLAPANRHFPQ